MRGIKTSVSNVLSTTYVYKVWVQTSEQTYQPNILLSSTNLFIGGWWREDFAWWRVRWWRDRSLVASSLVASLLGGEVTGYLVVRAISNCFGDNPRLRYFILWMVEKTGPIISTNQIQNLDQARLGHPPFPRFRLLACFHVSSGYFGCGFTTLHQKNAIVQRRVIWLEFSL